MDNTKTMTAAEVIQFLGIETELLERSRLWLDFPPPIAPGLLFAEDDVMAWVGYLDEIRQWRAAGLNWMELAPPVYLANRETVPPSED